MEVGGLLEAAGQVVEWRRAIVVSVNQAAHHGPHADAMAGVMYDLMGGVTAEEASSSVVLMRGSELLPEAREDQFAVPEEDASSAVCVYGSEHLPDAQERQRP